MSGVVETFGAVKFIGNVKPIQLREPIWTVNSYGGDVARVPWNVTRKGLNDFIDGLQKWSPLKDYPSMYLQSWSPNDDVSYPTVELNYVGIRDGKQKAPEIDDDLTTQNVSAAITDDTLGQITANFTYKAARTVYKWTQLEKPGNDPKYKTTTNQDDPRSLTSGRIVGWIVKTENGASTTVSLANLIKLLNTLTLTLTVSFNANQVVPDSVWECTSTVDYILQGS